MCKQKKRCTIFIFICISYKIHICFPGISYRRLNNDLSQFRGLINIFIKILRDSVQKLMTHKLHFILFGLTFQNERRYFRRKSVLLSRYFVVCVNYLNQFACKHGILSYQLMTFSPSPKVYWHWSFEHLLEKRCQKYMFSS